MAVARTLQDEPKKRLSPAAVRRQQEMAAALMQPGQSGGRPITNWAEGLNALAEGALGGMQARRAEEAESAGLQARSDALINAARSYGSPSGMGGGFGMAALPGGMGGETASIPDSERASYIRNGLIQRGLPDHVADGFLANFQDESGLDPNINEANPIVPGSRGGFGLYQLTGPRRVAYEQFASNRGVSAGNIDTQLDWLMHELQGPEAAAARNILGSQDTASAATAIVNDFLRPAPEHRASRTRRYAGLPTSAPSQMAYAPEPMSATPARASAGVQVASLDPSAGYESALGQGAMRATGQASVPSRGGAYTLPDSELDPESRARLEALRTPQDMSNVRPYSGPGAVAETPGYVYDRDGFRHNGVQELPDIGPPQQAMPSQPQPYQVSQAPAPYQPPMPGGGVAQPRMNDGQALAQLLRNGSSAPATQPSSRNLEMAQALLGDPWTQDIGEQLILRAMSEGPQASYETFFTPEGGVYQRNSTTGELNRVSAGSSGGNRQTATVNGNIVDVNTGQVIYSAPSSPGDVQTSLNPIYGQDEGGNTVILQPRSDGTVVRSALPEGVRITPGTNRIDTGTHIVTQDSRTGQTISVTPKNNFDPAFDQAAGAGAGRLASEGFGGAPQSYDQATQMLGSIDGILQDPNLYWATGVTSWTGNIPGSPTKGTRSRMDQLGGQAFLQAFESLKGGGQITEVEGLKATQAIGRLDSAQSYDDYVAALNDLRGVVFSAQQRALSRMQNPPQTSTGVPINQPGGFAPSGQQGAAPSAAPPVNDPLGIR